MPRDTVEVGIVGDYQSGNVTHESVAPALAHHLGTAIDARWVPTEAVREEFDARRFDGLWIAPGSPYRSMTGALTAIRSARDYGVPLLGTCGGFQHVVIEFARNVAGFADAQHAEYDPYGSQLFITQLSCSLVGQTMSVDIAPDSRAASAYGRLTATERYYCNFGLDPKHEATLATRGLMISGRDQNGEARIVELKEHAFFVATLFVPQTSSHPHAPHPLIGAFATAVTAYSTTSRSPEA